MGQHDKEYGIILNHVVDIGRRSGTTTTAMGDLRPSASSVIVANASVFFEWLSGLQVAKLPGDFKNVRYRMFAKGGTDVREGDSISPIYGITGLSLATVRDVRPLMDFDGLTHHVECLLDRVG